MTSAVGQNGRVDVVLPNGVAEASAEELQHVAGPLFATMRFSGMAMAVTDPRLPDNPIVFVNDAFLNLTGYAAEEVIGRNCRFLQDSDADDNAVEKIRDALDRGSEVNVDIRNRRKNGSRFWNRLFIAPVPNHAGRPDYFFSTQFDCTAERGVEATEQALRDASERLRSTTERLDTTLEMSGAGAVWDWSIGDGRIVGDLRFSALYGIAPERARDGVDPPTFFSIVHPDDEVRVRLAFGAVMRGAEILAKEYRILVDGMVRWVRVRGRCQRDEGDRPLHLGGVLLDITDHKLLEERLRIAQSAGGIGTFTYVDGFSTASVSTQFCRILGLQDADVLPISTINAVVHAAGTPLIPPTSSAATGAAAQTEVRVRRPADGEERWIACRGEYAHDAESTGLRFTGVIFDITEQNQAQAVLRESEAYNRQIFDSTVDYAIVATDLRGRVTRWNEGARRILGWSEAEMLGETADRFFTPEDRSIGRMGTEMALSRETGKGNDERWHLRKSGERFWAQGEMMPLRREGGGDVGFVKVLRDRTDERLREQRTDVLSQISAALLEADEPDEDVLGLLTRFGADALGFDRSYIYTASEDSAFLHLTHSIGVGEDERAFLRHVSVEKPLCGIVAGTREPLIIDDLQGTVEPRYDLAREGGLCAYAGFPVADRDRLYGVISFGSFRQRAFDSDALSFFATIARALSIVRERLTREAALRDLNATLETRVVERTRELMVVEESLRQSQKMEAVGQLTGGVAHDFNNLLTIIRSSIDLLSRPNLTEERRQRYVAAISETVTRASKLTGQLLAFARRQTLNPEVIDVGHALRSVIEMLDTVTGSRIVIDLALPDEPCHVLADLSQLETALVNMVVNARDAMNGEGRLSLAMRPVASAPAIRGEVAAPGPCVAVSLTDTGSGIAPDLLARIFEPFFTTKDVGKGTGLGLSQVFGFAKQSGGDVDVESALGVGTTFTLYLPMVRPSSDAVEGVPAEMAAISAGAGQRVLVVEDNGDVGRFCAQILEDLGYVTTLAVTAEEALDRLAQGDADFDVVFSDVVMPGMGGLELAKKIHVRYPGLPVLLASGYSHVLAREGTHGFPLVHKPYSADQLTRALDRLLARSAKANPK